MYGGGYMGNMGFFPGMGILVFIVVLIIMYLFVNSFQNNRNERKREDNSLEILRNRFARGEITKEEYLSMKDVLTK